MGRKKLEASKRKRRQVTLSDETCETLKIAGGGNMSEGIAILARQFEGEMEVEQENDWRDDAKGLVEKLAPEYQRV